MLSIVIPTFNAERFILSTIECLKDQIDSNFEVILVDKSSTDSTIEICEKSGLPIRIIDAPDLNLPEAINLGMKVSVGEYLCWLNGDDIFVEKNISKLINSLVEGSDEMPDLLIGDFVTFDENDRFLNYLSFHSRGSVDLVNTNVFTGAMFFSRKLWDCFGGFSGNYVLAFEYELLHFCVHADFKIAHVPDCISGFRIHGGSLSFNEVKKMTQEARLIERDLGYQTDGKEADFIISFFEHIFVSGSWLIIIKKMFIRTFRPTAREYLRVFKGGSPWRIL